MGLVRRAIFAVLGTALTLAWWTIRGPADDHTETLSEVPAVIWEGGTAVTISASNSQEGNLHLTFNRQSSKGEDEPDDSIVTNVKLAPGDHTYTIQVPPAVHGYVELGIDAPPIGAKAAVKVHVGEKVAAEDAAQLEAPLEKGYAFFAQVYIGDYAAAEEGDD